MQAEKHVEGTTLVVRLSGRLTFTDYANFRDLVASAVSDSIQQYVFDLEKLEFIDSAGLGMLLLARDEVDKRQRSIKLKGAQGQVKRILDVARFDNMFD